MNYSFQLNVYDVFHDLLQKAESFKVVAIVSVKENMYRIHFWGMIKDETMNIMKKVSLSRTKSDTI